MIRVRHTAEQLRLLASICDGDTPHLDAIVWRPRDVIASNGHVLVSIPLPEDGARSFALPGEPLSRWIAGLGQRAEVDEFFDEYTVSPIVEVVHEPGAKVARIVEVESSSCRLEVDVAKIPERTAPGGKADANLDKPATVGVGFQIQSCYLRLLTELHDAFHVTLVNEGGGTDNGIRLDYAAKPDEPFLFSFPTQHGRARVAVMGMRPRRWKEDDRG